MANDTQEPDRRHDQRERRERLRELDPILLVEFESAGALGESDFRNACLQAPELRRLDIDDGTAVEWWYYAMRRRLLEPADLVKAGEFALSSRGEDRLIQATESNALKSGWEKQALTRVLTFVAPSAAGVAAVVALYDKNGTIVLVALGVVAALVFGLLCSIVLTTAVLQPLWDRFVVPWVMRVNVKWLAGKEVRIGLRKLPKVDPRRLPQPPEP